MQASEDSLRLGILAIAINVSLMIIKIGVGIVGSSYALVADGIESASDIFTSIITWAGFRLSLKPADEDHPYGHGKIDALTGMFSGACLFAAALFIAYESIIEIRTPHHLPAWFTLPVLLAVIVVKELLSRRVFAAADDLDSSALKGDAWHHRSDAVTSAAAAIGITVALIGGKGWEAADDWGALAACCVIFVNAFLIVRTSAHDATDRAVAPELRDAISSIAETQPGVRRIEKCIVRKSGTSLFVELHVHLDAKTTIEEGHRIGHRVKAALLAGNPRIKDVLVHLEPDEHQPNELD
ncbi:MAG: cation diffusion facilitator family transporter [Verrucomicrobiota bacterium]|nr:cation diffusion facilitator family transporter [Verrucomicrobiota bacterium]